MNEEYGNIPDGFLLSQSEIDELRKSKRELTDYAKQKLKELIEKQEAQNDGLIQQTTCPISTQNCIY